MLTTTRLRTRSAARPLSLLDRRLGWALSVVGTVVAAVAAMTPPVRRAGIAETIPVGAAVALLIGVVSVLVGAAILTVLRALEE